MLTPLYDRWVGAILPGSLPLEPHATCDNCAMCAEGPDEDHSFRADAKCCTYMPWLPNFSVGGALLDGGEETGEGRDSIRRRMSDTRWLSPLGLMRTPSARLLGELGGQGSFGRSSALLCPHFSERAGGSCSIWQYRNGVCATWYCKHVRGRAGLVFWDNLKGLLGSVEELVATWCALELGITHMAVARSLELEREPVQIQVAKELAGTTGLSQDLWGSWVGRCDEFYGRCAELTSRLTWADIASAGGLPIQLNATNVRSAYEELQSDRRPSALRFRGCSAHPVAGGLSRLETYSPYNPLLVPAILTYWLAAFDGRPVDDVLEQLQREHDVVIDVDLVRRLVDFGVLYEESGSQSPGADDVTSRPRAASGYSSVRTQS